MPLDDLARRSWPERDPDALMRRVFSDELFKQCLFELLTAAFNAAGIHHGPITPEAFERVIANDPIVRARLQAVFAAVEAEQRQGWRR
jgi:hypothetical protein